jgi:hypothetical protein
MPDAAADSGSTTPADAGATTAPAADATETTATPSPEASLSASASIPHGTTASTAPEGDEIDAEWDEFNKTAGETTATADPKDGSTKADDADADNDDDDTATVKLSDDDRQAIKRHQLDPDEIEALRNLKPESRQRWIANLDKRAKFTDDLQRQLREARGEKPDDGNDAADDDGAEGDNATRDTIAGAAKDDELEAAVQALHDEFEPYGFAGVGENLRNAFKHVAARQQAAIAPVQSVLQKVLGRLMNQDIESAFEKLELPDGIDKSDEKVRKQLLDEANLLLNGSFDFDKFNYAHAIPRAAQTLFHKQQQARQQAQAKRQKRESLRGTAEPVTRPASARPPMEDDDAFDEAYLKAQSTGDTATLERLRRGGG